MATGCPECGQDMMVCETEGQPFTVDPRSKAQQNLFATGLTAQSATLECYACGASWAGYAVGVVNDSAGLVSSGAFYPTTQTSKGDRRGA